MDEQRIELDERELAINQRHFKEVIWKILLFAFLPVGIHVGLLLISPKTFESCWPYTTGGIFVGMIVSTYVRVTKNRCPICNKGLGRDIPTQKRPRCSRCGSRIV